MKFVPEMKDPEGNTVPLVPIEKCQVPNHFAFLAQLFAQGKLLKLYETRTHSQGRKNKRSRSARINYDKLTANFRRNGRRSEFGGVSVHDARKVVYTESGLNKVGVMAFVLQSATSDGFAYSGYYGCLEKFIVPPRLLSKAQ